MNSERVFVGNILEQVYNKHKRYTGKNRVIKSNAILIKTKYGFYIDADDLHTFLDLLYTYGESYKGMNPKNRSVSNYIEYGLWKTFLLSHPINNITEPLRENWLEPVTDDEISQTKKGYLRYLTGSRRYVDEEALRPYVEKKQSVSLRQLKRNSRNFSLK